jgi:hypothetical protein
MKRPNSDNHPRYQVFEVYADFGTITVDDLSDAVSLFIAEDDSSPDYYRCKHLLLLLNEDRFRWIGLIICRTFTNDKYMLRRKCGSTQGEFRDELDRGDGKVLKHNDDDNDDDLVHKYLRRTVILE